MCLFGGGAKQDTTPPAAPAPLPSPTPTETAPGVSLAGRQRQISMLKFGALSTIKAGSGQGIAGNGPDLLYPGMGVTGSTGNKKTTGS